MFEIIIINRSNKTRSLLRDKYKVVQLHDLHWLPVASRIKYKLLIVTFKALRTGTPGYLSDLLVKQKITKRTRSQSIDASDRLIVPLYSGERSAGTSYSVAAPKQLWNSLPANISSRSLDTFKKHLKTHYFKEHFYGMAMVIRFELRIRDQIGTQSVLIYIKRNPPSPPICWHFEDDCVPNGSTGKVAAWRVLIYS